MLQRVRLWKLSLVGRWQVLVLTDVVRIAALEGGEGLDKEEEEEMGMEKLRHTGLTHTVPRSTGEQRPGVPPLTWSVSKSRRRRATSTRVSAAC